MSVICCGLRRYMFEYSASVTYPVPNSSKYEKKQLFPLNHESVCIVLLIHILLGRELTTLRT